MPILEPNYFALWGGKQTGRGTPLAVPTRRYVQVGGDFNIARDDGSEEYSDLTKYGTSTDWVNSVLGNGTPAIEATASELAHLLWLFHGAEVVTAVTGPPLAQKHAFTPSSSRGHYATFYQRIGSQVIKRHQFNDCIITQMVLEGSTANKAVRATPTILSLDPGAIYTVDPTQALPTDKPFLYTDGAGSFTIDGVVFAGQSQFTLTINDDWSPVYGDGVTPFDLVQGNPGVTLGATVYMDAAAVAQWNKIVYGTTTPALGAKPITRVAPLGAYGFDLIQRDAANALTGLEFKLIVPGVKWAIPDYPGPNTSGGATEIALAGQLRSVVGQPLYTIEVSTANTQLAFTI